MNFEIIKSEKLLKDNKPKQGDVITTYNAFHDELNAYMFTDDGYGNVGLVDLSNGSLIFNENDSYNNYSELINGILDLTDAHESFISKSSTLTLTFDLNKETQ